MDWQQVTFGELIGALREVSWSAPRPISECFHRFGPPPPKAKQVLARLKNNLYYYRTNYLIVAILSVVVCFLRNPLALAALACCTLGLLCCNDPFATTLNDSLLHYMRKLNPRLVARARAKAGSDGVVGLHKRKHIYIVVLPRWAVVAGLLLSGGALVYMSSAVLTLSWAILLGIGLPLAHALTRLPNLKAKIASAREEFRAVWRGYQAEAVYDYTHSM